MACSSITIATYNCNGLANSSKRNEVFAWLLDKENVKIICVQETHSNAENELKWQTEWGGSIYFSHGLSNSRGVMILFKEQQHAVHSVQTDDDGRWILLDVTVDNLHINLINIYAPNEDNPCFFEKNHDVILCQKNDQNIMIDKNYIG